MNIMVVGRTPPAAMLAGDTVTKALPFDMGVLVPFAPKMTGEITIRQQG